MRTSTSQSMSHLATLPIKPSSFLFAPVDGHLSPLATDFSRDVAAHAPNVGAAIDALLGESGYPCTPAQSAFAKDEYLMGVYEDFGSGSRDMLNDLLYFRERLKKTDSLFLSFFAVYLSPHPSDETEYEATMWKELSNLSKKDHAPWDKAFSSDPASKRFCVSYGGDAFFTVSIHPSSSRKARTFSYPAIVFNLFDQFEELERRGLYESTVLANRKRDLAFQGSINPMVEQYADIWESIQFSGKNNSPEGKCPFQGGAK